jgi:DNA helicase II / ATP-dependent DNA helicase PcrA
MERRPSEVASQRVVEERGAVNGSIACQYCGGRHPAASDVRDCWARSTRSADPPVGPAATGASQAEVQPVLGRSVLVRPGQDPPEGWSECARWDGTTEDLEAAWRARRPLVIEVTESPTEDEVESRPVWSLTPSFEFPGERLSHFMFSNSVDARDGNLRWRWTDAALRLGASPGATADVVLPDGRPAFCDGGPLEWQAEVSGALVVPRIALLAGSLAGFGANHADAALAPDQLVAVTHAGGAARIIAPAGSGKTRVLTERARHVLRTWMVPGRAVTLVAFNKRAADEMVSRTTDLPELQIRTLNALGLSLINQTRRVSTIEESEVRSILDSLVDLPRRANTDPAVAWIEALSAVRLGLTDPEEVEAEYGGDVDGLGAVLPRYRQILADRGVVDFDEQIYRSIEILLTNPVARRAARASCQVLLVDEFQDLTPAHLLLIRLLAGPELGVFGVGDDDQTIYGYAGASPEWLINYRRYFPGAGEHQLEVNYRCPNPVVTAAGTLLGHNRRRVPKVITSAPGRASDGTELTVVAGTDPVESTVSAVESLVEAGTTPTEIAVLTRVNAALAPVQIGLQHRGMPVRAVVDESYLSRGGVRAALGWLRLATSGTKRLPGADIVAAARRPPRALSPRVMDWMGEQHDLAGLERLAGRLSGRDAPKILGFVADLKLVTSTAKSGTTVDVLRVVRDGVGLDQAMEMLQGSRRRLDRSAQTDDLDALVALARLHPDPTSFESWLRQSLQQPGTVDGVMLATIHSVKGREWPHVVVHDVSTGVLPHRLATDLEEERRVFHVALTRCSSSVTVVAGDSPSPFVAEMAREWTPSMAPAPTPTPDSRPARRQGPAPTGKGAESPRSESAHRAAAALKEWRRDRARTEAKPAYIYLTDETIEALASAMPSDMSRLARIKGIGPAKLEAYGDEILALLEAARTK